MQLELLFSYGLSLFIAALTFALGFCFRKKSYLSKILKASALVLAFFFLMRYMLGQDAIENMFLLESVAFNSKALNFFALILVWFVFSANFLVILYPFFEIKWLKWYLLCFALPVSVLGEIFLGFHFTAILGQGAFDRISTRLIFFVLETGVRLGLSLAFVLTTSFKRENVGEKTPDIFYKRASKFGKAWIVTKEFFAKYWAIIFIGIAIIFSTMPSYAVGALLGKNSTPQSVKSLSGLHRLVLYIGFILPFIIHISLKNRDFVERKFALLFICLGTLLSFSVVRRFDVFADPVNWPLHLCNTAMYIMPIVLIFKMKKFFYFTYFINVVGAFFAMIMPNYSASINLYDSSLVIFYINHYIAFFMPILFVSLGMFAKPRFKQFVYSMLGFLAYFVLVLILNAVFTGQYEAGLASKSTDFFFINSDFIADKLGTWAENLRNNTAVIPVGQIKLTFYPVYQTLFFVVYIIIGLAMWFIYEMSYDIAAGFADLGARRNNAKLEQLLLLEKLNGRGINEPMNPENKNKLILHNFSKKYASSPVYAVKDANLTVYGGEIFGFLGPNGAGKSTIIKSIVGIQPITSGSIEVCGYDCDSQSVEAKRQIGFVPDHYALYEKLTGREYINYIADLYGVSVAERTERIERMVNRFELTGAFDNQMKTYSHGMKQKIAIMAALVHDPKVWILDEPLTGLDPTSIFQVKECMKEHVARGNIVFFSSHIIDVVERICDRIAIIKKGQILVTKTVKEIEDSGISLEKFYMQTIGQDEPNQLLEQENVEPKKARKIRQRKTSKE